MKHIVHSVLLLTLFVLNSNLFADTIVAPPQTIICNSDKTLPDPKRCTTPDGQILQYLKPDLDFPTPTGTYTFNSGTSDPEVIYYYKNLSNSDKPGIRLHAADQSRPVIRNDQAWQEYQEDMENSYACQAPVEECAFTYPFDHPSSSK